MARAAEEALDHEEGLDHEEALDLAALAVDGPLPVPYAERLATHLAGCPACRAADVALRRDALALGWLAREDAPHRVRDAVVSSALRAARGARQGRLGLLRAAALAAVIVAGAVLLATLALPRGPSVDTSVAEPIATWTRSLPAGTGSVALAGQLSAIASRDTVLVAVGSLTEGAAAWRSRGGQPWESADASAGFEGRHLTGVAATPSGFVAVGFTVGADGASRATSWTSADGRAWSRGPDAPALRGGAMNGVAVARGDILAVGLVTSPLGARVWISQDGVTWDAVPDDPSFAGAVMTAVTATPDGFVAVGHDAAGAVAWRSPDGRHWSRATSAPTEIEGGRMMALTGGGPGLVAVGFVASLQGTLEGAVWTSSDGASWRRAPSDPHLLGVQLLAVTWSGHVLVALGRGAAGGIGFSSLDGLGWRAIPPGPGFANAALAGATSIGGVVVAVGGGPEGPAIWRLDTRPGSFTP